MSKKKKSQNNLTKEKLLITSAIITFITSIISLITTLLKAFTE